MDKGQPEVGDTFTDGLGRELTVQKVVPDDRLGRQVRGRLKTTVEGRPIEVQYSCSFPIFDSVWAHPHEPLNPDEMSGH